MTDANHFVEDDILAKKSIAPCSCPKYLSRSRHCIICKRTDINWNKQNNLRRID